MSWDVTVDDTAIAVTVTPTPAITVVTVAPPDSANVSIVVAPEVSVGVTLEDVNTVIVREAGPIIGGTPTYAAVNKQGTTILSGSAVAAHASGTGVVLASAANASRPCVGLMVADTAVLFAGEVQTDGILELTDWTAIIGAISLTRGPYYLDPTTPGKMTAIAPTLPGYVVQYLGTAISPTKFDISPMPTIQL